MNQFQNSIFAALLAGTLGLAIFCSGCTSGDRVPPEEQLQQRLDANQELTNIAARDKSMNRLALDAAHQGDAEISMNAAQAIVNTPLRDKTADACAREFYSQQNRSAADGFATLISDAKTRDTLRRNFAMGAQ